MSNTASIRQAFASVLQTIEEMPKEQFEREVLRLNGTMTQNRFDKVIQALKKFKHLDAESIAYQVDDFGITCEEFEDVFNYLEAYADKIKVEKEENTACCFPDYRLYFTYKGMNITWRILIGQGTAQQLFMEEIYDWPEGSPMIFNAQCSISIGAVDSTIKFYKA